MRNKFSKIRSKNKVPLIANVSNIYPPLLPYLTYNKGIREDVAGVHFLLREFFLNKGFWQYYFLLRNAKNILSFFSKKVNIFVVFQKIYDICNSKSQTTFFSDARRMAILKIAYFGILVCVKCRKFNMSCVNQFIAKHCSSFVANIE